MNEQYFKKLLRTTDAYWLCFKYAYVSLAYSDLILIFEEAGNSNILKQPPRGVL